MVRAGGSAYGIITTTVCWGVEDLWIGGGGLGGVGVKFYGIACRHIWHSVGSG